MSLLFLVLVAGIFLFGFVVFFGAPYLPTFSKQTETALDLLALKPGQTLLELGSGDGRVLVAAAKRGINVVGYELNPILALFSWLRTRKYGGKVRVVWGNYWHKDWPLTDGIFVFLLDRYMKKLDTNIVQKYPGRKINPVGIKTSQNGSSVRKSRLPNSDGVKLVSFAFKISGKKPVKFQDGLYLYRY